MIDPAANTTLAILAGGEGSRMGQPKALLSIAGMPILRYLLESIRWPGPKMLVTSPSRHSPPGAYAFDAEVIDSVSGFGPLCGIRTALQHARTESIVVMPVDMPAIGFEPLRWLGEQLHQSPALMAAMLRTRDEIQPLPAAFRKTALPLIDNRLTAAAYSLRALAAAPQIQILTAPDSWPAEIWTNLNFPTDLTRFEQGISARFSK
jgi:molybdopterin-guanine dinucleotide biosynthesis protein A